MQNIFKEKIKGDAIATALWIAARNPTIFHRLCRRCQQQYNKYIALAKESKGDKEKIAQIGKDAMGHKFVFCPRCDKIVKGVKL